MVLQLHNLWAVLRELDVRHIRHTLDRPVRIAVVGMPGAEQSAIVRLVGGIESPHVETHHIPLAPGAATRLASSDLVVLVLAASGPLPEERQVLREVETGSAPVAVCIVGHGIGQAGGALDYSGGVAAVVDVDLDDEAAAQRHIARAIVALLEDQCLALGRRLPAMRDQVSDHLIRGTALANAEFALLSTLPSWIPLVGGMVGSGADVLVLTKNQVLLVLKLAGIHGRDLGQWRRLLVEIAPVVGSALLWRSLARALVGLLPTPVSAIPKTTIAYVGTVTVGEIARHYYRDGMRLDRAALARIQRRALVRLGKIRLGAPHAPQP